MNRIKILELIDGGFLGGGQANILSIAKNIDKEKFEVHVAAMGGSRFESAVRKLGVPFFPVEMPKFLRTRYLKHIQALHDKEKYDIIHSHGGVAGFYGRIMKKHNPALKSIHTIHGIHYINIDKFLRRNVSKTIEQYLIQFTDKTICVSRSDFLTAVDIKITDEFRTVVIPNGIDLNKFKPCEKNLKLLNDLGLNENNFIVGNVSRFDIQKNQKLIIETAYYLVKKYPDMRFVFVGSGKYMKKLIEFTRTSELDKYIIFAGERENPADYYSVFDLFVFPTFWEGMPYVLLEAMASKLPVICSNLPGLNEIITNNYSALTIDPNDMDELFRKITELYLNKVLSDVIGSNANKEVQKYDELKLVKDYEKVYMEAAEG